MFKKKSRAGWLCADSARIEYADAWKLQTVLVDLKYRGLLEENLVLFVEHPPVFTLGRRGGKENLKVTEAFLTQSGIKMVQVERGGDITFHGPGQLVIYPIVNLRSARLSVVEYVQYLEEVMIRTVADWGVSARRNDRNRGVWVRENKIGSVGIAVRRGVAFHGASLNVNVSLEPFGWMHPCGLKDIGVTSLENERSERVSMNQVRHQAKKHFMQIFGAEMTSVSMEQVEKLSAISHRRSAAQGYDIASSIQSPS